MSAASTAAEETLGATACGDCLRRSRLLGQLSAVLDRNCRADGRLFELLALGDEQLITAIGGRRREQLRREHAGVPADASSAPGEGCGAICVHDRRYPAALHEAARNLATPQLLHVSGGPDRLHELASRPTVAMLGTLRPSDYGLKLARRLGRELAASGVVVVTQRLAGIAFTAQQGVLDAGGATLLVAGDGLSVPAPLSRRETYDALSSEGCVVSELPPDVRGRTWGAAAGVRIAVGLSALVLLVEAHEDQRDLRGAELARLAGRAVAALPGHVGSSTAAGCHALLRDGARLVRDAEDVLDLLYGVDAGARRESPAEAEMPWLGPHQQELLRRVGEGVDTIGALAAGAGRDPGEMLQALTELELSGVLDRVDRARYAVVSLKGRRVATTEPAAAKGTSRAEQPDRQLRLRYGDSTQMES